MFLYLLLYLYKKGISQLKCLKIHKNFFWLNILNDNSMTMILIIKYALAVFNARLFFILYCHNFL